MIAGFFVLVEVVCCCYTFLEILPSVQCLAATYLLPWLK